ncbi:hypothetical protein GCM10011428_60180 [Streptomyces violaceus]
MQRDGDQQADDDTDHSSEDPAETADQGFAARSRVDEDPPKQYRRPVPALFGEQLPARSARAEAAVTWKACRVVGRANPLPGKAGGAAAGGV